MNEWTGFGCYLIIVGLTLWRYHTLRMLHPPVVWRTPSGAVIEFNRKLTPAQLAAFKARYLEIYKRRVPVQP